MQTITKLFILFCLLGTIGQFVIYIFIIFLEIFFITFDFVHPKLFRNFNKSIHNFVDLYLDQTTNNVYCMYRYIEWSNLVYPQNRKVFYLASKNYPVLCDAFESNPYDKEKGCFSVCLYRRIC